VRLDTIQWAALGFASGLAIGGAVALIMAPKSGRETRKLVQSKVLEAATAASDGVMSGADKVKEIISKIG
jgi:gas vesicle protein